MVDIIDMVVARTQDIGMRISWFLEQPVRYLHTWSTHVVKMKMYLLNLGSLDITLELGQAPFEGFVHVAGTYISDAMSLSACPVVLPGVV